MLTKHLNYPQMKEAVHYSVLSVPQVPSLALISFHPKYLHSSLKVAIALALVLLQLTDYD